MAISYFFEQTTFPFLEKEHTQWITQILENENCILGEINVIFCNDTYLHKINVDFLNHDTLTDIITFDNSIGNLLHGEIYISADTVKSNAVDFKVSFEKELARVLIHGFLHLCGYKDKTDADQQEMTRKEDESLEIAQAFLVLQ